MKPLITLLWALLALPVMAQETVEEAEGSAGAAPPAAPNTTARPRAAGEATIHLQTTVTGNQEQPRVLYILPWQSPEAADIEFQTLSSQSDEVFGHLEREELRRSLEAEAALNKVKP